MSALSLERSGERLIVRTVRSGFLFWFGAAFAGFAAFWLVSWFTSGSPNNPNYWTGLSGFLFVLISRKNFLREIHYAFAILVVGLIIYFVRSWRRKEWPFTEARQPR